MGRRRRSARRRDRAAARGLVADSSQRADCAAAGAGRGGWPTPRHLGDALGQRGGWRPAPFAAFPVAVHRASSASAGMPTSPARPQRQHVDPAAGSPWRLSSWQRAVRASPFAGTPRAARRLRCRRPAGCRRTSGISSAKRFTFCQSIAAAGQKRRPATAPARRASAQQRRGLRRRGSAGRWCAPSGRSSPPAGGGSSNVAGGHDAAAAAAGDGHRNANIAPRRVGCPSSMGGCVRAGSETPGRCCP